MINWNKADELREDIGVDDFGEIVEVFLQEVEEELATLTDKPVAELPASMHFLKGSALNLGFEDFAEKCRQGERAANQIEISALLSCYNASKKQFLEKYQLD
ncbi:MULTISPECIES: Hpt domain-containing protein [Lentibacter]|jgi:histidine phosphotransfer protein HptB|uniref:Hpt domain-containing protein n=1 Tax=Lentibacter algarum TaxID=576131 RepID=A0A1H3MXM1_9RHOB|nr:Hpt domain-containing protein [Lentibacter algarum]MCO4776140.1 Hpt domain-containing protein [Lentibacter algarum]MCO4827500.1 Hpt domain-containing protein [Lentibacter algarum]WIF33314.1 putative histidine-containing phosphotransfer protein [Lentibacter algarum]SDY81210.1 Hpt domain-containing protein [Lentibacter algarum]